jgi:DNA-binding Lrp family transcriptional regulator
MQRSFEKPKTETAFVMVNCESGMEPKVADELRTIDGISEIKRTFGRYDIVAKIQASSAEKIGEIITLKIRGIDSVLSTTTLISIEPIIAMQSITV